MSKNDFTKKGNINWIETKVVKLNIEVNKLNGTELNINKHIRLGHKPRHLNPWDCALPLIPNDSVHTQ